MRVEMFDIVNYGPWGDLVKLWASAKSSRPANIAEFKQQLQDAGVGATFPVEFTGLTFIETSSADTMLVIKLPPPDLVTEVEASLKGQGPNQDYPLPTFYADDMINPQLKDSSTEGKLQFHSKRVGEYTIRFCG